MARGRFPDQRLQNAGGSCPRDLAPAKSVCEQSSSKRLRRGLVGLAIIGVTALMLVWFAAVLLDPACPAAGPLGTRQLQPCTAETRTAAGLRWSLVIAGSYVLATGTLLLGRRISRVRPIVTCTLLVLCLFALGMVISSTGYAVQPW